MIIDKLITLQRKLRGYAHIMHKIECSFFKCYLKAGLMHMKKLLWLIKKVQTCIIEIDNLLRLDKQYSDIVVSSPKVSQKKTCYILSSTYSKLIYLIQVEL